MSAAREIADRINAAPSRTAFHALLDSLLAPQIEVRHVPPMPGPDRIWTAEEFRRGSEVETRLLPKLAEAMAAGGLAGLVEERRALADGDDIVVDSVQRGLLNGVNTVSLGRTLFHIVDGKIAGVTTYMAAGFGPLIANAKASPEVAALYDELRRIQHRR